MGKFQNLKQIEGPFYLFCAFTLAGTSVLAAKYVSLKLGTFTITAVSQFFALLFLLPICRGKIKTGLGALSRKDYVFLFMQALFGMFLFRMFLIIGLTRTSAGEAGILTGATPAITAFLAWLALKEPSGLKKSVGIISTVAGVFLIQGILTPGNRFSMEHFSGNMLVLCATACESLFNILSRHFVRSADTHTLHPAVQTALVSAMTMGLCFIPAALEAPLDRLHAIGQGEWFALIWYGVFVTALAFIFWYAGISRCGAITAAAFSGMMPFTSLLLSVLILGEQAGFRQWFGAAFVIAGIILIGSSGRDADKVVVTRETAAGSAKF